MVAAAAANEVLAVSDVSMYSGPPDRKRFEVRADPDWKGPCPGDPPGLDLADQRTRVFLLDGPGGVIVIFVGSLHAADHEAFLAQAMPLVESFDFTP